MSDLLSPETRERRRGMLRTAMGPAIALALEEPDVVEVMVNPDGRLWLGTAAYSDTGTDGVYLVAAVGGTPRQVVSGLPTVLGLLWRDGELYVARAGGVTAYGGYDGTSFQTERTVVSFPSGGGEVNGTVLGPDGRLVAGDQAEADVVRRLFEDYDRGICTTELSNDLNRRGVPTPRTGRHGTTGKWSKATVWAILTNPVYTGDLVYARRRQAK